MPPSDRPNAEGRLRVDKWLWAARFFKTRSLAAAAVEGGKVQINGQRSKPAREVRVGDRIAISAAEQWEVTVRNLSDQRGPAPEARQLYDEAPASQAAREAKREARRFVADPAADRQGRPTKRDRRQLGRLNGS